jgi:signal transduction histidine kinase
MCDLITWPWPRKLLTLPFTVRLGLCLLCFPCCMAIYLLPWLPTAGNGVILTLPMGLASWLFSKRGACPCFFGYLTIEILYHIMFLPGTIWTPLHIYSTLLIISVLFLEGSALVSLRHLLDEEEAARQKAEQGEQQTRTAYEQQRQLNQLKNQFILNVNHELRTPLTALYGYLELLHYCMQESGQLNKSDHAHYLERSLNYCEQLRLMVSNVLDTMTIGNDKGQLTLEPTPLRQTVCETLALFIERREGREEAQQTVRVQINCPEHIMVQANAQCLRHILYNLLSNAFKYTVPNTPIAIGAREHLSASGEVQVWVQDQGPGIPPDEVPLLFGQFVRLRRDLGSPVRGTGLGLYISKHLVEVMKGHIWVESSGIPGEGSCFSFTLPRAPEPAAAWSDANSSYQYRAG